MKKINYSGQWSVVSGQWSDNRGQEFIPHPSSLILRRLLLSLAAVLCLTTAPAHALDISDYTAYPPFLPRVTSPNILFLLDYSKSMVRPAHGTCTEINNTTDSKYLSNCGDLSKTTYTTTPATPTVYSNLSYDYDKYTKYPGYFDNGSNKTFNNYSAGLSYKYNYETSGSNRFQKNSSGLWNGNWLNWLAMMQFDVLKKVVIGGDITPAPEGAGAGSLKLQSNEGTPAGVTIRKTVNLPNAWPSSTATCKTTDTLDCTKTQPTTTSSDSSWPAVAYNDSYCSWDAGTKVCGLAGMTDITAEFASSYDEWQVEKTLPFPFTFYGNTYTKIYIDVNGFLSFTAHTGSTYNNLYQLPTPAATDLVDNLVAPHKADLKIDTAIGGKIKTYYTGTAPNRVYAVTWENVRNYSASSSSANALTFQVLLYEGSNHIIFQYMDLKSGSGYGGAKYAAIGVENSAGTGAKQYSWCGVGGDYTLNSCASDVKFPDAAGVTPDGTLAKARAIFVAPHITYNITPANPTAFSKALPLASTSYVGYIDVAEDAAQTAGGYYNGDKKKYYDHETTGLFHDFRDGELGGTLGFRLGIMRIGIQGSKTDGGEVRTAGVGKYFNSKDTSSLFTNARSNEPDGKAPLAEALYEAANYFGQVATPAWSGDYVKEAGACIPATTSGSTDPYCFPSASQKVACCKSFVLLLSSGNYSSDFMRNIYGTTEDEAGDGEPPADAWKAITGETSGQEWVKTSGGWLDNVAYKAHTPGDHPNDLRSDLEGTQNLALYAVNTFGTAQTTLSAAITSSVTTISVASTTGFSSSGKIQIDDEIISYTGKTATSFTGCTRGSDSTAAAAHLISRKVYQAPVLDGAKVLKRAAKYGGFDDSIGATANVYDAGEDDKNGDGVPDTYFEASGGSDLKSTIISAVMDIMKTSASGTSVSVLSTSAGGEGAIYQAYFYPARIEGTTDERTWPGYLRSFFLDKYENLRDDSGGGSYQSCPGASCAFSGATDAKLIMATDRVAQMYLDETTNEVKANMIIDDDGILPASPTVNANVTMDQIASIWEGGKKLALRDKGTRKIYTWVDTDLDGVVDNGDFSNLAGEALSFDHTSAATVTILRPYLQAIDDTEAGNVMSFIRGNAVTGYRNRCISITGASKETGCADGTTQRVWTMGDIIYSTPTLVSGPGEQYDLLYGDANYKKFRDKYQNRRRMVYVGANDGMLHAFNAGVYTAGDNCDGTTAAVENGCFAKNPSSSGWDLLTSGYHDIVNGTLTSTTAPGLGDELWAVVPHDNLPHLAWLACNGTATDPSVCGSSEYTHVYYVDGRPKVTDVRIFSNTDNGTDCLGSGPTGGISGQAGACHPGGWGTIMIMSMRLGGGAIDVDINGGGATATGEKFRSAYYAFDITDPEKKPRLLWRFNGIVDENSNGIVDSGEDKGLGFTTSYPAIAKICYDSANPDSPPKNCTPGGTVTEKWYMIVGNGSNNRPTIPQGTSVRDYGGNSTTLTGKVFVVDISDGSLDKTLEVETTATTYMGDPLVVDENFDFTSDVVYVGSSIQATATGPSYTPKPITGKVYRLNTDGKLAADWRFSTLFDTTKPVLIPPSVAKDSQNNLWVFFGTGRLRNPDDLSNTEPQAFYGIKDACGKKGATCTDTYTTSQLANSSASVVTLSSQAVSGVIKPTSYSGDTPTSYSTLQTMMRSDTVKGWYVALNVPTGNKPSERVLSRSGVLGGVVLFTSYTPVSNMCSIFGDSSLYALNYETGTAYNKAIVGTTSDTSGVGTSTSSTTGTYVSKGIELGKGMPTAVGIAVGEKVTGFVQKSTGEIIRIEAETGTSVKSGAASWKEKSGGGGTSEIETIYKHIVK